MATTILVSSIAGIHQNSNLSTGGGTDDTALIQTVLSGTYAGGLILIQDGVSLITGLNVSSNTTIQCNSACGFYLANSSNRSMFRNANRSGSTITDHDITFNSGTFNGNIANQTFNAFHCEADGTPMSILQFYGVRNFTVLNALFHNMVYAGVGFGNFQSATVNNCTFTEDSFTSNETGVDVRGPGTSATISNCTFNNIGDDAAALNSRNYQGIVNLGPYLLGGNISNVIFENLFINACWSGIDLVSDGGFTISNVQMTGISGTVRNYALYYNLDLYNTPTTAQGKYSNIYWSPTNTISQSGPLFGAGTPPGLLLTGPVPMYDATNAVFTNSASSTASSGTTLTAAYPVNTTGLSYLLAYILVNPGSTITVTSVTDTLLNTWTQIGSGSTGTSNVYLYRCSSNKAGGGANTVTAHFSGTLVVAYMEISEYGNVQTPFEDSVPSLSALTTTANFSSPTITTKYANEIILGLGYTASFTPTPAAGFSLAIPFAGGATVSGIYKVVSSLGSYTPNATSTSQTWQWFTLGLVGLQVAGSGSSGASSSWLTTALANSLRGLKH